MANKMIYEKSAQKWAKEQTDIWEMQQRKERMDAAGDEFDRWADEERERWKEAGLTDEEEDLLQSLLDEARENWDEDEQGNFDEWAAEERARWEEWGEKKEEKFQEYLEKARAGFDEKESEKFANWIADHRCDKEQEFVEQYYSEGK